MTGYPGDADRHDRGTHPDRDGARGVGPTCVGCGWTEQEHAGCLTVEGCRCSSAEVLDAMIVQGMYMTPEEGV
jgi:hypothetical protein